MAEPWRVMQTPTFQGVSQQQQQMLNYYQQQRAMQDRQAMMKWQVEQQGRQQMIKGITEPFQQYFQQKAQTQVDIAGEERGQTQWEKRQEILQTGRQELVEGKLPGIQRQTEAALALKGYLLGEPPGQVTGGGRLFGPDKQLLEPSIPGQEYDTAEYKGKKFYRRRKPEKFEPRTYEEAVRLKRAGVTPKTLSPRQKEQKASFVAGLKRGRVVIGKEFGEPATIDIKTFDDAMEAIGLGRYDPNDPQIAPILDKYRYEVGGEYESGGKVYRIIRIDEDGVPVVDPNPIR